jgi:hypothetical protein|tara:strand:- start:4 stop:276 length:273 start_codon:yes stop_codon:yes gene_type:complete
MKEEIIYWKEEYKNFIQNIETINEAINEGFPIGRVSKILDIRMKHLSPLLDYANNPTPRFPYKSTREKIKKFAESYREIEATLETKNEVH